MVNKEKIKKQMFNHVNISPIMSVEIKTILYNILTTNMYL